MIVVLQSIILVLCLALCAFFAGMETGVIAVNRLRVMHKERKGSKNAGIISGYLKKPDTLLGTTLVGTNLVSVMISTFSAQIAETFFGVAGSGVAAVVSTLAVLFFGEFLPKAWFTSRPLERCLPLAGVMKFFEWCLFPLSWLTMRLTACFVTGGKEQDKAVFLSRDDILWLTHDSEAAGRISMLERLMINRVLALQLKSAADIMTPMEKTRRLLCGDKISSAVTAVRESGHLKLPVFTAGGKCTGILYVQDVLKMCVDDEDSVIDRYLRKPFFVRSDMRADDILPVMRKSGHRMAIVRDRSGKSLGIVTISGLLKILVGDLPPETTGDRKSEQQPVVTVRRRPRRRPNHTPAGRRGMKARNSYAGFGE